MDLYPKWIARLESKNLKKITYADSQSENIEIVVSTLEQKVQGIQVVGETGDEV